MTGSMMDMFDIMVDGMLCIDTAHLSRQTMGDKELQTEILGLYQRQARLALFRLTSATSSGEVKEIAHTIKGASLGIGAQKVAETARELEEDASRLTLEDLTLQPVRDAIEDTLVAIEALT
jgi:HPt (histidine-containing phosphotransfer) domain-containing protein